MRITILLLGFVCFVLILDKSTATYICYQAIICIHNGIEKCGINSKGTVRRFLDSCDIKEYNCLKRTDYVKTSQEKCSDLPGLDEELGKYDKGKKMNVEDKSESDAQGDAKLTGDIVDEDYSKEVNEKDVKYSNEGEGKDVKEKEIDIEIEMGGKGEHPDEVESAQDIVEEELEENNVDDSNEGATEDKKLNNEMEVEGIGEHLGEVEPAEDVVEDDHEEIEKLDDSNEGVEEGIKGKNLHMEIKVESAEYEDEHDNQDAEGNGDDYSNKSLEETYGYEFDDEDKGGRKKAKRSGKINLRNKKNLKMNKEKMINRSKIINIKKKTKAKFNKF